MTFAKRVLFVAPATDLNYSSEEADNVINTLNANQLSGHVTLSDLLGRIRSYQPIILIISSHGFKEGIQLSDGLVDAGSLKSIITTSPLELVYLNTCESINTALRIHAELPIEFISTIHELPDASAFVTMTTFAHHLSRGESYVDAWYMSKGAGDRSFIYLPKIVRKDGYVATSEVHTQPPKVNANGRLEDPSAELMRLGYLIYGNEKWDIQGLIPRARKLEKDIIFLRITLAILAGLMLLLSLGVIWHWSI